MVLMGPFSSQAYIGGAESFTLTRTSHGTSYWQAVKIADNEKDSGLDATVGRRLNMGPELDCETQSAHQDTLQCYSMPVQNKLNKGW